VPVAAGLGGMAMSLGSLLARAGGAAGAIFRGANGVTVRMSQLWPYVRKYGPVAVYTGLGISAAQLATLLEQAPKGGGGRGRGRGISARDVKTTRRTLKSIKKLYHMMPTRPSSGGGRYYYHRHRGRR